MSDKDTYEDIIDLPHFVSRNRPHMSNHDRAAQFAPFAALTGYEDSIDETARLTDEKIELSEQVLEELDQKLQYLASCLEETPIIQITHFVPDERKEGGAYITEEISVQRIDFIERLLISTTKEKYPIDYIAGLEGDVFKNLDK